MLRRRFIQTAALASAAKLFSAPKPEKLALGQIGTTHAHAGDKYATVVGLNDLFEQAGVAEGDAVRREALTKSKAFAAARWRTEAELLGDPAIQGVVIETSLEAATPTALRALQAGKHVHLDKPGGTDHGTFQKMRREAEKRGRTLQMGYMLRYNPGIILLQEAVRSGWLGEIRQVDATMNKFADPNLRRQLLEIPGHGMLELGCHLVDTVVDLLGEPSKLEAQAVRTGTDALPCRQTAWLSYAQTKATITCDHNDPKARRFLRVEGSRGWMQVEPLEGRRVTYHFTDPPSDYQPGEQTRQLASNGSRYAVELQDFARQIRGGQTRWNAAHDICVHAVARLAAGLS
jgi:predicted dehydrogenase